MPIVFLVIGMAMLMLMFNDEPINYSIMNGNREAALTLISKIYNDDAETVYKQLEALTLRKDSDSKN